jgi:aminoglycoside phosphotransferase (APT) family kinase protein
VHLGDYLAVITAQHELVDCGRAVLRRGQFHDVVVTETAAYRFPRDPAARAVLARHATVLKALAEAGLGFAVPTPLAPVDPDSPVGSCFLATTLVPGAPLPADDPRLAEPALADELGLALASLAGATARLRGVVPAFDPRRWARFAVHVQHDLFPLMSPQGRARARRELDAVVGLPPPAHPVLVHGDLGGENLMWQPGPPRLAGVVDWDEVSLDDPANDVASLAATYGWPVAARAVRAPDDPGALLARARTIQATFALQHALPAASSGDIINLADGLHGYR